MIIDFHTHTFPEAIAGKAIEKLSVASGTVPYLDGTSDSLAKSEKNAGIDLSVVLPVATNPLKCGRINEISAEENSTGKGLLYFGAIHPDCPDWKEELDHIVSLGLKGIKLHPVYQGIDFNDVRTLRILERAGQLGLIVVTHAGDDIGFPGEVRCSPEMIADAVNQIGPVKLVLAHMGGWNCWEKAEAVLCELPVFIDTSFSVGTVRTRIDGRFGGKDIHFMADEDFLRMMNRFGYKRLLFGTDSPWSDQKESLDRIKNLPICEEIKNAVLGANAKELLGII